MTAAVITIDIIIAAAGVAELVLLAYLLHRDRHLIWHPGDPAPGIPADAPIRTWQRSRSRA